MRIIAHSAGFFHHDASCFSGSVQEKKNSTCFGKVLPKSVFFPKHILRKTANRGIVYIMFGKKKAKTAQPSASGSQDKPLKRTRIQSIDCLEELALQIGSSIEHSSENIAKTLIQAEKFAAFRKDSENSMKTLTEINVDIQKTSGEMTGFTRELESVIQDVNQISTSVSNTAEFTLDRARITEDLTETVAEGEKKVRDVLSVIDVLHESMDAIKEAIAAINDISDQTNLLAMNAAIEAAHAGKAGLGFAVVAGEIRKLSAVTRQDSANIEKTLKSMMDTLNNVRKIADETSGAMKMIEKKVTETTAAFSNIAGEMQNLSGAAGQISESTHKIIQDAENLKEELQNTAGRTRNLSGSVNELQNTMGSISRRSSDISETSNSNIGILDNIIGYIQNIDKEMYDINEELTGKKTFPFARIVLGHLAWITRVRALFSGTSEVDTAKIPDSHSCFLGKWIDTEAKNTYAYSLPVFSQMVQEHEKLHNLVIEIFRTFGQMTQEQREERYQTLVAQSNTIVTLLRRLKSEGGGLTK